MQSGITWELKNDESLTCTSDVGGSRWVGGWRRVVELEPPSTDDAQKPVPTLLPPLTHLSANRLPDVCARAHVCVGRCGGGGVGVIILEFSILNVQRASQRCSAINES